MRWSVNMQLEFKPDFEDAASQWDAFWQSRNTRPAVSAVIPRPGVKPVGKPAYAAGAAGDFEPVIDQLLAWAETHEFLGDAIPFYYLEFSANHFAALLGAEMQFAPDEPGGWIVPAIDDLSAADIRFDRECHWWRRTVEFAQALRARCGGKLLIASNTMVANLDALAALYGTEQLLVAMLEAPGAVHRALAQIDRAHAEILDALSVLLDYKNYGSITRHGMYCRGRVNVPQCDFSCMIGADMFREFVLPYLRREMQRLDAVEYHLDGPDAIRHLPALGELEELDVIQWQPGAGKGQARDWTRLYDQIDGLGKGQIRTGDAGQVKLLWQRYKTQKLFYSMAARTRAEVEDCLAELDNGRAPTGENQAEVNQRL